MKRLDLDLELKPEPPTASPAVLAARQRRALVVGLGGGRESDSPMAKSSFAERRLRSSDTAATRFVDPIPGTGLAPLPGEVLAAATTTGSPPAAAAASTAAGLRLDDALVVPAGALIRGYVRCRALLLVGDVVGNVHCTAGPVVIRSGASLKGRLVASGDVYVCGTVGDTGGGAVITTRGKLTLAPGARVDGDVRSGWLDLYDGAMLNGAAKGCED
ncbi:bactofilin family protein [Scleromatobacter humisilvae]|uniref:Polymer-forming cytoskeletal protein n=1 Tax=Scleromatobacter humisilvae TaxID=2897159 RepID=A0A9X2C0X8_9BURK|nr:polymer-forming cytoskeletal protein [Scleromatobacter humisilvae]MCK9684365.1 polymer-forming cytoskeletal protein [Scleromatobacter humisilvae]